MLLSELGQRIRAQRERLRLKQHDIAHALQVSPQAVSKWERGENGPDLTILGELARLLGVSTDWLLDTHSEGRNVFTASVLTSTVVGAYEKSLHMAPRDFAIWANGCFLQLTESALGHDGVPVCYMGDAFLCFFSGTEHRQRAVRTAFLAKRLIADPLLIGLSSPPLLFKPAISRPWRPETPEALSQPILSGVPRARKAVPRLAARRFRRQERRAGGAADAASWQRLPAEAGQRRAVQRGAKKWLSFTYTLLVGASNDDTGGLIDVGSAYLFDGTTGALLLTLNNPTPAAGDQFGVSVASTPNGDLLVGASFDDTGASDAGSVYLFDGTTGALLLTINNPTPAVNDQFGRFIASTPNGDLLVAADFDDTGASDAGSVYLFEGV